MTTATSQKLHKVEARIDGKWIAIFSSHHRNLVTTAFATYQKVAPWRVRISADRENPKIEPPLVSVDAV